MTLIIHDGPTVTSHLHLRVPGDLVCDVEAIPSDGPGGLQPRELERGTCADKPPGAGATRGPEKRALDRRTPEMPVRFP